VRIEPVGLTAPSAWPGSSPYEAEEGELGEGRLRDWEGGDWLETVEWEFVRRRTAGRNRGC
jgi:hypothetical protein